MLRSIGKQSGEFLESVVKVQSVLSSGALPVIGITHRW